VAKANNQGGTARYSHPWNCIVPMARVFYLLRGCTKTENRGDFLNNGEIIR
jgi:hypothetical protein